ncbi:MAG: hypothetical protein NVSMB10_13180 [Steroidobacteraceae bacterium]
MTRWFVGPLLLLPATLQAHSASDAYLTLSLEPAVPGLAHGQWDIALRDLDFVLQLDDNGDGQLTWGEIRHHQADIERYALPKLRFNGDAGAACAVKPLRQLVAAHADGAYATLFFDVQCPAKTTTIAMNYSLFFSIDPSHRGIFVMHAGANTATAVLSPDHPSIKLGGN